MTQNWPLRDHVVPEAITTGSLSIRVTCLTLKHGFLPFLWVPGSGKLLERDKRVCPGPSLSSLRAPGLVPTREGCAPAPVPCSACHDQGLAWAHAHGLQASRLPLASAPRLPTVPTRRGVLTAQPSGRAGLPGDPAAGLRAARPACLPVRGK